MDPHLYTIIRPMKTFSRQRALRMARIVLALTLVASGADASAQLRLPSLGLPGTPLGNLGNRVLRDADQLISSRDLRDLPDLRDLRAGQVQRLLRQHRDVLEADPTRVVRYNRRKH